MLGLGLLAYFLWRGLGLTGGRLGVPLDDAWIHFQFARNLSTGQGFSFNPGIPTPGSTAPLWTLFLAAIGLFTQEFLLPSLLFSAGFFLLTVVMAGLFTRELSASWPAGLLAGLGVVLTGRFLWAGLAGMETTAFAAFSLGAVWVYHRRGLGLASGTLFALASQLRPEGHLLFTLALALALWDWFRPGERTRPTIRTMALGIGIYALITLPYVLFSLATTGRLLPNTFYVKAGGDTLYSLRTLRETLVYHWQDNPLVFVLIPFGILPTWRRSRLTVLWLFALLLVVPIIVSQVWHHGRYTMPLIPFQMIVAALGAHWLWSLLPGRRWLAPATLILLILAGLWRLDYWAGMLGTNSNEILEIDVALGEWLAGNTPAGAVIAVDDIGAIGFLSGRTILDLQGLVSPELWPALQTPIGLPRSQALTRELSHLQPDFLAIFPTWHFALAANDRVLSPVQRFWVDTHTIIFDQEAMVYRPEWPYITAASPQNPVNASFGDAVALLGFDREQHEDALEMTLYWQSIAPVDVDYDVFIHLLDETGRIVAQVDTQPLNGLAATSIWQAGDLIRDPHTLPLPPDLPAGTYTLVTGLFDRDTMTRLPLVGPAGEDNIILDQLVID